MGKSGSRSFPAVVIYNVDCDDNTNADAGQTVIFEREETPSDDKHTDEWNPKRHNGKSSGNGVHPASH